MKKLAVLAVSAVLALAFAGCSAPSEPSSSSSEPEVSSSSSTVSQVEDTIEWADAKSAEKAAKGAKIKKFGAPSKLTVDDKTFKDPSFAYAEGVAQATYENGATGLIVRKADGKHEAPLTDRDKTEFAHKWSKSYDGLDATLYGPQKGAVVVVTWSDGTAEYGVTYQGLGGEEVTMDSDDVSTIVKALKKANATEEKKEKKEEKKEEPKNEEPQEPTLAFGVEDFVFNNGLGEYVNHYAVQNDDGSWSWAVVTRGADGNEYTSYADLDGNYIGGETPDNGNDDDSDEPDFNVENFVFNNGLGEFAYYYRTDDGWAIVTRGADGSQYTSYADDEGNYTGGDHAPSQGDDEPDFDVEQAVWDNGLGEFQGYYRNGEGWAVVTRGSDGNEYTNYFTADGVYINTD